MGGLEGQGQREIIRALAGALPPVSCDIVRHDREGRVQPFDPRHGVEQVVRHGVGLVPEDRKLEGLYLELPIADNIRLGLLRGLGLMRRAPRDTLRCEPVFVRRLRLRRAESLAQRARDHAPIRAVREFGNRAVRKFDFDHSSSPLCGLNFKRRRGPAVGADGAPAHGEARPGDRGAHRWLRRRGLRRRARDELGRRLGPLLVAAAHEDHRKGGGDGERRGDRGDRGAARHSPIVQGFPAAVCARAR